MLAFVQIFTDIFLISALVWHTGGVDSHFVVLYLFSIFAAAFVLKWNVSLMAAGAAAILFCIVTLLYSVGVVPADIRAAAARMGTLGPFGPLAFARFLLLPVTAFFLTGILAGTLARRLATARLMHDEILEGIGEGIVVLDGERKALYHNREFRRLLGLTANANKMPLVELLGKVVDQAAAEVMAAGAAQSPGQASPLLHATRVEASYRHPDGRIVPFAVRLIPVDEPGGTHGLIVAVDDITAEKKMEELLKHRQRIETMGAVSATIAHEIRNPLASIRGAVQEISRSVAIPEDKKVLLDIVLSESDRLDQIITDFLRFARMRPPALAPVELPRVLDDVVVLLRSRPEAKGVDIRLDRAGDGRQGASAPLLADAEQLRQLFLNLGVNALQALADEGAGRAAPSRTSTRKPAIGAGGAPPAPEAKARPRRKELTLRMRPMSRREALGFVEEQALDRPGIEVDVADTGPGMPPDVRNRVFEPFYTTKSTGTGLGLAIVERIVQSHEGLLSLDSREGEGSTFRVWLPANLSHAGASGSGWRPAVTDVQLGRTPPTPSGPAAKGWTWETGRV
jgi:two-component system sensor histidine kinase PilS (NtrC family)